MDEESFEWYDSVFYFHHPNHVGPTTQHLFGLVLNHEFHHSMTWWNGCEWPKLKTSFTYFQNSKTEFQWQVGKLDEIVGPSPVHCHIRNRLSYYRWSSSISFQFSGKFLLKIFPLLTSLSQPLLIFTSLFIPNKLAPPPNPTTPNPATLNQPNTDPATPNPANSINTTNPITTTHHPLSQPQLAHHDSN